MLDTLERLDVCLVDPSYSLKEARRLTGVSEASIRRWIDGYPVGVLKIKEQWLNDTVPEPLLVSFLELVEILVAGKFRAATGKKFDAIRKYNNSASAEWNTPFPFAHQNLCLQKETLPAPVVKTLEQMEYTDGFVSCWFPLGKEQPITVDPRRGSGAPVVKGRRVRVVDIRGQFKAGETIQRIAEDFVLQTSEVEAALRYALLVAA